MLISANKKIDMQAGTEFIDQCTKVFRKNKGRLTDSRLTVVKILARSKKPLTAKQIYERLDKKNLIDQASIYRTIDILLEYDLIHQVFPDGGFIACFHSSCESRFHILISCKKCESINEIHIPEEIFNQLSSHIEKSHSFRLEQDHFQLSGTCKNCP